MFVSAPKKAQFEAIVKSLGPAAREHALALSLSLGALIVVMVLLVVLGKKWMKQG